VAAVPNDAWGNETPCDISVREVVGHVVAGNLFAVRLLAGASAADATAGLDGDLLGDDPQQAVRTSGESQQIAFADADPAADFHHPSGDISWETFLRFRLGELVVHGWDLAVGGGLDTTLDQTVCEGLWAMVEPNLKQMRAMGTFGDGAAADLPADASAQAQVLNAFGRRF
jgi:uncharacterized protein (TIGR03086 family)